LTCMYGCKSHMCIDSSCITNGRAIFFDLFA
jgi:hypothetical protein